MLDLFDIQGDLSSDQRIVRESVAKFVDERALPIVSSHFENHTFPRELIREIADLGLLGSSLSGYGCGGLDAISYGLICHELERADSALRSFVSVQSSLVMFPLYEYGTEEQKQHYLPKLARGDLVGCFGLTEPQGGSDPGSMTTSARRHGQDWILNGAKMWITNAPIADVALIWAKTEHGVRGFLVDRGTAGFSVTEIDRKFSLRASSTGAIFLDDVRVPSDAMLPGTEAGLKTALACLTHARFGICWGVLGAAQACMAQALDFTRNRHVFGRPLAATQAVQVRLAEMARKLSTGQLLALQLGRLKNRNAARPEQVSLAKWQNCRAAIEVARDCRDMLGGYGISAEYVPIRHMLNLESVITYEGTETIHQLSVGRWLTGLNAF